MRERRERAARSGGAAAPPPASPPTEITIGATLPLTGTAAVSGQGLQAGIQIAVDEINAAGGIERAQGQR